ncbi:hypothetical protein SAMN04490355_102067 [Pelosinus propionicus DSM 13327]|uniref:Uncharacterized protein n=1 Tax=Pelosinus propionicus DSM 13327 TaxID=1123291 RepID=A0A1I4KZA8_9FIRM|nr:hypothetical protein SAMN04490355_102067 [Pelosinus propionicus DSM 13327]
MTKKSEIFLKYCILFVLNYNVHKRLDTILAAYAHYNLYFFSTAIRG